MEDLTKQIEKLKEQIAKAEALARTNRHWFNSAAASYFEEEAADLIEELKELEAKLKQS